jgi:endonuclease YncB( thermonuclease family)
LRGKAGIEIEADRVRFGFDVSDFNKIPEPDGLTSVAHLKPGKVAAVEENGMITLEGMGSIRMAGVMTDDLKPSALANLVGFLRQNMAGKDVAVEMCSAGQDPKGRQRAVLYVSDNTGTWLSVNQFLVQQGYAPFGEHPRCHILFPKWINLEKEAKQSKRGMWATE